MFSSNFYLIFLINWHLDWFLLHVPHLAPWHTTAKYFVSELIMDMGK
jgi:hypothetical protein